MRTERAPTDPHRLGDRVLAGPEADRAAGFPHLVHRVLDGELAAGMRLRRDAGGAAAVVAFAAGGQELRQSVTVPARHVPDTETCVVMMNAARRSALEKLHRGVRRARGEHPVIAGTEAGRAGGREAHRHAVLQQQRRARRWHGDHAGRSRGIEVLHLHRMCRLHRSGTPVRFWSQRRTRMLRIARQRTVGKRRRQHRRPATPA